MIIRNLQLHSRVRKQHLDQHKLAVEDKFFRLREVAFPRRSQAQRLVTLLLDLVNLNLQLRNQRVVSDKSCPLQETASIPNSQHLVQNQVFLPVRLFVDLDRRCLLLVRAYINLPLEDLRVHLNLAILLL